METTYKYRVLYADTDAMGVVYYGSYLRIYEAARGDFLRQIEHPFSQLYKEGIVCPVVNISVSYVKYVELDEEITVKTKILEIAGPRMIFQQQIFNNDSVLLNEMTATVAFIDIKSQRPIRCPKFFENFSTI